MSPNVKLFILLFCSAINIKLQWLYLKGKVSYIGNKSIPSEVKREKCLRWRRWDVCLIHFDYCGMKLLTDSPVRETCTYGSLSCLMFALKCKGNINRNVPASLITRRRCKRSFQFYQTPQCRPTNHFKQRKIRIGVYLGYSHANEWTFPGGGRQSEWIQIQYCPHHDQRCQPHIISLGGVDPHYAHFFHVPWQLQTPGDHLALSQLRNISWHKVQL